MYIPAGPFGVKEDVSTLLRAAGARLLPRLPPSATSRDVSAIRVLIDPEAMAAGKADVSAPLCSAAQLGVPVVHLKWLMDSVGTLEVAPLEAHLHEA